MLFFVVATPVISLYRHALITGAKYMCKISFACSQIGRVKIECDGTRAETRFGLPAKRTSPFMSVGLAVQSTAGSRVVRISAGNAG